MDDDETETTSQLVPAEIQMFFKFESKPPIYSVVHLCHYRNDKSSVLSIIWMKEFYETTVSDFPSYKYNEVHMASSNKPLYHVVQCDSIHSHCLLLPFKKQSCLILQIIHPNK
jgi:hypothetical protein